MAGRWLVRIAGPGPILIFRQSLREFGLRLFFVTTAHSITAVPLAQRKALDEHRRSTYRNRPLNRIRQILYP
jgi:hypothetical protein